MSPYKDQAVKKDYQRTYMRDYMRARRGSSGLRGDLPFAGVDGEGGGEQGQKHPGYHAYFLLRGSGNVLVPKPGNNRIVTSEALEFLSSLPNTHTYVAYFFDYDVTKILEDVPFPKLKRLMDRSSRTRQDGNGSFPVSFGPYEFDYMPRKEFRVRKMLSRIELPGTGVIKTEYAPWVVINDVGPFFQCKFVEALEKWKIGTPAQLALIRKGKNMRGNFEINDMEEISEYNAMECELLSELMEKFREACNTVGIVPAKWQGPGQLAKALMANNGVPKTSKVPLLNDPKFFDLLTYARNAYYGGRPEIMAIGPINRRLFQYDLNSAYPRGMLDVPCLMHGGWEFREFDAKHPWEKHGGTYALLYGTYTPKPSNEKRYPMWFGLPFRTKEGTINYPGNGTGWYWDFEIRSAVHQKFVAKSGWVYTRRCKCQPLGFVSDVYQQRLDIGKDDAGIVLKLGLNSLYGICVQSIGKPQYANPIWGSFITAFCRTEIQNFIHSSPWCKESKRWCGKDVLMVATDSLVTFNERTDIRLGKGLGEWSEEEHPEGMFLIQPGLYFGSSGKRAKTRGVPLAVIEEKEQEFRQAFDRMVRSGKLEDGDVSVPQRMFVGIRYGLQRKNTKLLGQWIEFFDPETGRGGKTIRFDWTSKRAIHPVLNPMAGTRSYIETFPKIGNPDDVTAPYSKDIGGLVLRENLRAMFADQPDWVQQIEPGELNRGRD
jgi:hypothetical protein